MTQEIVIPYVRGKIADGCKRFDLDIVCRMVIEYDRVQAENEKLTERLEEWREQYATVISEACPPDEQHCTCVPTLRAEVKRLRAALNLTLPLLRDDVMEEETGMCYYCGGVDNYDTGEHKPDCVQVAAYLAARKALEVEK